MKKTNYLTPRTETIVIRFERYILASGQPGAAGGNDSYDPDDELDLD